VKKNVKILRPNRKVEKVVKIVYIKLEKSNKKSKKTSKKEKLAPKIKCQNFKSVGNSGFAVLGHWGKF